MFTSVYVFSWLCCRLIHDLRGLPGAMHQKGKACGNTSEELQPAKYEQLMAGLKEHVEMLKSTKPSM